MNSSDLTDKINATVSPYNNEHTVDSLVDQFGEMTFGNYTTFCMLNSCNLDSVTLKKDFV
jgi:hypothetical protein